MPEISTDSIWVKKSESREIFSERWSHCKAKDAPKIEQYRYVSLCKHVWIVSEWRLISELWKFLTFFVFNLKHSPYTRIPLTIACWYTFTIKISQCFFFPKRNWPYWFQAIILPWQVSIQLSKNMSNSCHDPKYRRAWPKKGCNCMYEHWARMGGVRCHSKSISPAL